VVASSTRPLGGGRGVARVDLFVAAWVARCPRINIAAASCAGTVSVFNTVSAREGRHANRKTHQGRARDADAKADQ
jgi:hypothetical protein